MIHLTLDDIKGYTYFQGEDGKQLMISSKGMHKVMTIYKNTHPCERCGKHHCQTPLVFQHIRPSKYHLTKLGYKGHPPILATKFLAEINKCKLLCHDCSIIVYKELQLSSKLKQKIEEKTNEKT